MLGWRSRATARISRKKRSTHAGLLDDVLADDLEDFVAGQQAVVGEVDDPHAADAPARGRSHSRGGWPAPAGSRPAGPAPMRTRRESTSIGAAGPVAVGESGPIRRRR